MARAAEESREFDNPNELATQVREYVQLKNTTSLLEERQKQLRGTLFGHLDTEGEIDDKGNIYIELPEAIDGIVRIEKQRRTSRKVDDVAAEEILVEELADVFDTVKVVNEDKLMAAFYEGKLDENDLERIYPATITWALTTKKK